MVLAYIITLPSVSERLGGVSSMLVHKSEFMQIIDAVVNAQHCFLRPPIPPDRCTSKAMLECDEILALPLGSDHDHPSMHTDGTQRLTILMLRPPRRL